MRIGSLFSGYGGLDMGVQEVLGGRVVWHSDIDKSACAVLAHNHPDIPNLGDISNIDWATVEPIDVLTGGFPCQDVSHAGARRGMHNGTRSGLWSVMAKAIEALKPSFVVIENVRGLLSATASSDMEPCPWCLGDGDSQPPLRALGAVLADLAELGYDARWASVRASDIGACHRRERVFIVAYPADTDSAGGEAWRNARYNGAKFRHQPMGPSITPADAEHDGWNRNEIGRGIGSSEAKGRMFKLEGRDPEASTDSSGQRYGRRQDFGVVGRVGSTPTVSGRETRGTREESGDRGHEDASDPDRAGWREHRWPFSVSPQQPAVEHVRGGTTKWGEYEPAIRRWEQRIGRAAPAPTEPGNNGRPLLSPTFVEWMMGLPLGHLSNSAIGLSRANQLKVLGNGVVPQQAAHALRILLNLQP